MGSGGAKTIGFGANCDCAEKAVPGAALRPDTHAYWPSHERVILPLKGRDWPPKSAASPGTESMKGTPAAVAAAGETGSVTASPVAASAPVAVESSTSESARAAVELTPASGTAPVPSPTTETRRLPGVKGAARAGGASSSASSSGSAAANSSGSGVEREEEEEEEVIFTSRPD